MINWEIQKVLGESSLVVQLKVKAEKNAKMGLATLFIEDFGKKKKLEILSIFFIYPILFVL